MLSSDLKWTNQTVKATKAAKSIIAQLRNSFKYFDAELVRLLYVSLVRPHLEYAVPVWNPSLKKDIDMLENVQHRATRLVPGLKKESYEVRLKALKLTTLEIRRKRGDLIEFYKILNGLDSVEWKNNARRIRMENNLRRKGWCFHREPANIGKNRDNFFLNRTNPLWNDLPGKVKEAKSLNGFKAGLDGLGVFSTGV